MYLVYVCVVLVAVVAAEHGYVSRRPDDRCTFVGQFLSHPSSSCSYLRCDYGSDPWHNSYGKARVFAREMRCAPGTRVPPNFNSDELPGNPCTLRASPKDCPAGHSYKSAKAPGGHLNQGNFKSQFTKGSQHRPHRRRQSSPKGYHHSNSRENYGDFDDLTYGIGYPSRGKYYRDDDHIPTDDYLPDEGYTVKGDYDLHEDYDQQKDYYDPLPRYPKKGDYLRVKNYEDYSLKGGRRIGKDYLIYREIKGEYKPMEGYLPERDRSLKGDYQFRENSYVEADDRKDYPPKDEYYPRKEYPSRQDNNHKRDLHFNKDLSMKGDYRPRKDYYRDRYHGRGDRDVEENYEKRNHLSAREVPRKGDYPDQGHTSFREMMSPPGDYHVGGIPRTFLPNDDDYEFMHKVLKDEPEAIFGNPFPNPKGRPASTRLQRSLKGGREIQADGYVSLKDIYPYEEDFPSREEEYLSREDELPLPGDERSSRNASSESDRQNYFRSREDDSSSAQDSHASEEKIAGESPAEGSFSDDRDEHDSQKESFPEIKNVFSLNQDRRPSRKDDGLSNQDHLALRKDRFMSLKKVYDNLKDSFPPGTDYDKAGTRRHFETQLREVKDDEETERDFSESREY